MNGFSEIKRILFTSSNQVVSDIVQFELTREGYRVFTAVELIQGIAMAQRRRVEVVVIDLNSDLETVLMLYEELHASDDPVPMVILASNNAARILSGRPMEYVEILEKPFQMKTLKMLLIQLIQRSECFLGRDNVVLPDGCEITISTEDYQVYKHGSPIPLSQTEYELFVFLASHPGKVYSRNALMERVWNYESTGNDVRMVDVAIRRLRTKIEDDPAHPFLILTKRGAGYYFATSRQPLS